ncbi:MAG: hypothetical protein GXY80_15600, partial [Syntrophorhabdus aromaticivorans]|nr:hypothetical protein [Syntrophorhabdus aromaticivorans]
MTEEEEKVIESNDSSTQGVSETENTHDEPQSAAPEVRKDDKSRGQQEINREDMVKKGVSGRHRSGRQIIRECLDESFYGPAIKNFCFDHPELEKVFRSLMGGEDRDAIITSIMTHCYQNNCVEQLWECIKQDRKNQYDKYYPEWQKARETFRNRADEFIDAGESTADGHPFAVDDEATSDRLPLKDGEAVIKWF